jgi:hypothetical protein
LSASSALHGQSATTRHLQRELPGQADSIDGRRVGGPSVQECCASGKSEWQLQKALRRRWLSVGAQMDGEVLFLAGWEVMTNWEVNDAHKRWDLPSADFVLLDKQGRLVVMELKTALRGPGDCLRALCQVTHSAVRLTESFTVGKLAKLSAGCRGGQSTRAQSDPLGFLRDAHMEFFSLNAPAQLAGAQVRRVVAACQFGPRWPSMSQFFTTSPDDVLRAHLESRYRLDAPSNIAMRRFLDLPNHVPPGSPDVRTLRVGTVQR